MLCCVSMLCCVACYEVLHVLVYVFLYVLYDALLCCGVVHAVCVWCCVVLCRLSHLFEEAHLSWRAWRGHHKLPCSWSRRISCIANGGIFLHLRDSVIHPNTKKRRQLNELWTRTFSLTICFFIDYPHHAFAVASVLPLCLPCFLYILYIILFVLAYMTYFLDW